LSQRQRDYDESDSERGQIEERERAKPNTLKYLIASVVPTALAAAGLPAAAVRARLLPPAAPCCPLLPPAVSYPAAIAVSWKSQLTGAGQGNITGLWNDLGRFKTPTLRALAARAPYFHNGIAPTLKGVIRHYERHLGFV
jgi:hypothetical protein